MTMSAILISGILCAVVSGPLLSAGTVTIAEDLGVSISAVSLLTGESLLIAGCWWSASSYYRLYACFFLLFHS